MEELTWNVKKGSKARWSILGGRVDMKREKRRVKQGGPCEPRVVRSANTFVWLLFSGCPQKGGAQEAALRSHPRQGVGARDCGWPHALQRRGLWDVWWKIIQQRWKRTRRARCQRWVTYLWHHFIVVPFHLIPLLAYDLSLTVLRWPCVVDRTLKSNYYYTGSF